MTNKQAQITINAIKFMLDHAQYSEDVEEALNMAISALTEQKWIPCIEFLPEEDGDLYLVTSYAKSINRRRMHISRCYMNKLGFWSDVPIGYKVIAWMPLPEPYREDKE